MTILQPIENALCLGVVSLLLSRRFQLTLIALYLSGKTCHKDKSGVGQVLCPKYTLAPGSGYCVVNGTQAFALCANTSGCKYVMTTTDVSFNKSCPNCAWLGKDPLAYAENTTTCELPESARKNATKGKNTTKGDAQPKHDRINFGMHFGMHLLRRFVVCCLWFVPRRKLVQSVKQILLCAVQQ